MLDQKVAFRFGQFASMDIYGLQPYGGAFLMEPLDYGFNNRFNDYASFDPASGPGMQIQVKPTPWMYFKGRLHLRQPQPLCTGSERLPFCEGELGRAE